MSNTASGSLKLSDHFSAPVQSASASSSMRTMDRAELCTRGTMPGANAAASAGEPPIAIIFVGGERSGDNAFSQGGYYRLGPEALNWARTVRTLYLQAKLTAPRAAASKGRAP
eukprot:scaffold59842_cov64-Phaeocystis_antarctica.AAC.1